MNFNELIHSERAKLLSGMPPGAKKVLSAGCSGAWYFSWFEKDYGPVEQHIGLELFSPRPEELPEYVKWIANSVDDMSGVQDGSVDLVFSGQNIEHLSADALLGFILESNRVLKKGGHLILDSPNRSVTQKHQYIQPEHTLELSDDEIVTLLETAGFEVQAAKGILNCQGLSYDQSITDIEEYIDEVEDRCTSATGAVSTSFIWWVEAIKKSATKRDRLKQEIQKIYLKEYAGFVRSRFLSQVGNLQAAAGTESVISVSKADTGYAMFGPYIPLFSGNYSVYFRYENLSGSGSITFDICANGGSHMIESEIVELRDVPEGWNLCELKFSTDAYLTGLETRAHVTGVNVNLKFGTEIFKC